jgi:MFS family permease
MALVTPRLLRRTGHRRAIGISMALLGCCLISLPYVGAYLHHPFRLFGVLVTAGLMLAVIIYLVMGCCRAYGGVAITSGMMEMVPRHFMGRVQNTFYFAATALQLGLSMLVGSIAHRRGLAPAFAIVGSLYLLACVSGTWPAADVLAQAEEKDLVGQA